jgi:hypothetical protein
VIASVKALEVAGYRTVTRAAKKGAPGVAVLPLLDW